MPDMPEWLHFLNFTFQFCTTYTRPKSAPSRAKRSTGAYTVTSTQFSPSIILINPVNTPPELTTKVLTFDEDFGRGQIQIEYYDKEDDAVVFSIAEQPPYGTAYFDSNGTHQFFAYEPAIHLSGNFTVNILMNEIGLPYNLGKSSVNPLVLNVKSYQDFPHFYIVYKNRTPANTYVVLNATGTPEVTYVIPVDTHRWSENPENIAAKLCIVDPDPGDELTLYKNEDIVSGFNSIDPALAASYFNATHVLDNEAWERVNATFMPYAGPNLTVHLHTPLRKGAYSIGYKAKDSAGAYTPTVWLRMYFLINPCKYGTCAGPEDDPECIDLRRSQSWDGYSCACQAGYTGIVNYIAYTRAPLYIFCDGVHRLLSHVNSMSNV